MDWIGQKNQIDAGKLAVRSAMDQLLFFLSKEHTSMYKYLNCIAYIDT